MSDDLTEIGLTRLSRRMQERAELCRDEQPEQHEQHEQHDAVDAVDEIDATRLGSRHPGAHTAAAPPTPPRENPIVTGGRRAASPATPGAAAARERYGTRQATPVIATRRGPREPRLLPTEIDPSPVDRTAVARTRRARARRRTVWVALAIACAFLLVTSGILLVISTLGR